MLAAIFRILVGTLLLALAPAVAGAEAGRGPDPVFRVELPDSLKDGPQDGRLLLIFAPADQSAEQEPRELVNWDGSAIPFYGLDVEGWAPGTARRVDDRAFGFPVRRLRDLPPGEYRVQAFLNRYETFRMGDGRVLKLPPDQGEGQQWRDKPGNLYSKPVTVRWNGRGTTLVLSERIPPVQPFQETDWVKHVRIRSERLSKFWGRDMYVAAFVTLPQGFRDHPDARYPLVINHGHFPSAPAGWR